MLLMGILRTRYHGVIHLYPADAGSRPEIEFLGGEGPQQAMDQIQSFAVPRIREAIEPRGPYLRWEELDLEAGALRRHRSRFRDRFEFVLSPDERGIELLLPPDGNAPAGGRPWVPLRPLAEPPAEQRSALGWTVERPEFSWRYLHTRQAPPTLEMTWSCPSLPRTWAQQVLRDSARLQCRFGDGTAGTLDLDTPSLGTPDRGTLDLDTPSLSTPDRGTLDLDTPNLSTLDLDTPNLSTPDLDAPFHCQLDPTRDGLLVYRGYYPLPADARRPARRRITLKQPLVVLEPDGDEASRDLDADIPATVEALDFRAVLAERTTRLIAGDDLGQPFRAEVLTPEDVLLPEEIPAGTIAGLPWRLAVESAGNERHRGDRPSPDGAPGAQEGQTLHRWTLTPRPASGDRGTWEEVAWDGEPPAVAFGLHLRQSRDRAPRITRIDHRRATVGWRLETSEDDELLCLTVPHWVPVGCPEQVALPDRGKGFDYASEVRAHLGGLEERFHIDQSSEVSANRVFLGPRRWRFRDELHGEVADGEALGEAAGCVRWRPPTAAVGGSRATGMSPTDWAGGSAPVLLVRTGKGNARAWGSLYAPATIPWDVLDEVPAEPGAAPAAPATTVLLVPRSEPAEARRQAIWIDLWGFVCRYDRHTLRFAHSRGESSDIHAWLAAAGLEPFPRRQGLLVRSFAPLYAVRDREPRVFSFQPTAPRPTLRIGRQLDRGTGHQVLEVGAATLVRSELAGLGGPPTAFGPGRVPGTLLRLEFDRRRRVAWFALEQQRRGEGRQAGYLLSWDAGAGWRFRGFFARPGAPVELGTVRHGAERRRVLLGDETCRHRRAFRLTIDPGGDRWSAATPEEIARGVTPGMLREWERSYFARDRRPALLRTYGMRLLRQPDADPRWVFEFFERVTDGALGSPLGIRVWEPRADAPEEILTAGVKTLGGDAADTRIADARIAEEPAEPPPDPKTPPSGSTGKRILRPDDDDDF